MDVFNKLQCDICYVQAFFQGCAVVFGSHKTHVSTEHLKCVVSVKDA